MPAGMELIKDAPVPGCFWATVVSMPRTCQKAISLLRSDAGAIWSLPSAKRAELVLQARLDGLDGQGWKCETVHSVIKGKFGDTLRSRKRSRQRREPIIKVLVYNIHR